MTDEELQQYAEAKRAARAGRFQTLSNEEAISLAATVFMQVREECAQLCESYAMPDGTSETARVLAAAIRRME